MNPEVGDAVVIVMVALVIILVAVASVNYFLFYTGLVIGLLGLIGVVRSK